MVEKLASIILATPWQEWTAVAAAIIYVVLAARENIWCWPFGAISSSLYTYLCWYEWNLKLETILQVFYLVMAFYGWYEWKFGQRKKSELKIVSWNFKKLLPGLIICSITVPLAGWMFASYTTTSIPFFDAFTTVFSFWATFLVARKILETWVIWVIIDFASIFLYGMREAYLTALLFIAYTIIAAIAYFQWRKLMQQKA